MSVTQEQLMAYADGELAGVEKALVEAALAEDADKRAAVERHRVMRAKLSGAFAPVLDEPVPQRLVDAVRAPAPAEKVVDLAAAREKRASSGWGRREWGAMAACLMVGVLFGGGALRTPEPIMRATVNGFEARGSLAQALDSKLAADAGGAVRIGLTFRDDTGAPCRTFAAGSGAVSGLACRDGERWRVEMAVAGERQAPTQFRTAAVDTPAAVLALVEDKIDGAAFDARQEKSARDGGWR